MKPCNNHKFGRIHLHFQSFLFNVLFNRENKPTAAKRSIFLTFIPKQFKMKQFLSFFVMLTLQSPFRQDCLAYLESFAFEPGLNLTECLFVYLCIKFIHDQPIQSLQNNEDSFIDFSDLTLWVCYVTLLMASWMVHLSAIALRKTLRASSRISSGRSDSTSEIVFLDFFVYTHWKLTLKLSLDSGIGCILFKRESINVYKWISEDHSQGSNWLKSTSKARLLPAPLVAEQVSGIFNSLICKKTIFFFFLVTKIFNLATGNS